MSCFNGESTTTSVFTTTSPLGDVERVNALEWLVHEVGAKQLLLINTPMLCRLSIRKVDPQDVILVCLTLERMVVRQMIKQKDEIAKTHVTQSNFGKSPT
jgi:hypothetical protein